MQTIHPYITNDGSVGLFSPEDDDIYHSSYGALSEAWEKFVLPSNLKQRLVWGENVNILDICFGIGYNSKASMQTYLNIFLKNIYKKNNRNTTHSIVSIYTDNILNDFCNNFKKIFNNFLPTKLLSIVKIYTDNIFKQNNEIKHDNSICKLTIDAVDTNEFLFCLSPFMSSNSKNKINNKHDNSILENKKFKQVLELSKNKTKPIKEFQISDAVNIILYKKAIETSCFENNAKFIEEILHKKEFKHYLSKFMLNFSKIDSNWGYKNNKKHKITAFLHNIYYRYLSFSYKLAEFILVNSLIRFNYTNKDARIAIGESDRVYDIIFLDAFTPAKCPSLWSEEFFQLLYSKLDINGVLLTYSSSAAIRNAMLSNNFFVGKIIDPNTNKCIGTIASKNKSNIEVALSEQEIALINSKAGICYKDEDLNLTNDEILYNRDIIIKNSDLISSSQVIRGLKDAKKDEV